MSQYIGAIDQGTTSSRFIVFDRAGDVVAVSQKEHEQIYEKPGWVEHDPAEIWRNTEEVVSGALSRADIAAFDIAAIGITNQRETTLIWDPATGRPLHNALVWQDTRVKDLVAAYSAEGGQDSRFNGCSITLPVCAREPRPAR
jgi:glycerol kinase